MLCFSFIPELLLFSLCCVLVLFLFSLCCVLVLYQTELFLFSVCCVLVSYQTELYLFSLCCVLILYQIRVITKLPNAEQSYKGKVKTHKYINRKKSVNNQKTVKTVMTLTWYRHFERNGGLNQILIIVTNKQTKTTTKTTIINRSTCLTLEQRIVDL